MEWKTSKERRRNVKNVQINWNLQDQREGKPPHWWVPDDRPWFNSGFWPDEVPKHPEFTPDESLYDMFERQVAERGDEPFIWFLDSWVSYSKAKEYVDALAAAFAKRGIRKGDVVTAILPNSIQYVVFYYACQKIGAVASGINPTYKPLEVLHQIEVVHSKALVVLDALWESMVAPIWDKISGQVKLVVSTNIADLATGLSPVKKFLGKLLKKIPSGKVPGALKLTELLKEGGSVEKAAIDPLEDACTYIMTGGTTGVPKACVLTHYNIVSNVRQCRMVLFDAKPGMGFVGVIPLFHSFAHTIVMNAALGFGGYMILFPKPPATDELVATVLKVGSKQGNLFPGVEVLFLRLGQYLKDNPNPEFAGLFRLCVSAAGPLHKHVKDLFESASGGRVVEAYGMTETGPGASSGPLNGRDQEGKVGLPFPGTDWAIFPPDDFEKGPLPIYPKDQLLEGDPPDDEKAKYTGEICVCGPQVMKGYLDKPKATAETLREYPPGSGKVWMLTGDIGFMDATGQVIIRDRKKQLIKTKGYSVFPKEVEELVGRHEAVLEVAVAGLPDPKGEVGELVKAWVQLKPEWVGKVTEEELLAWCKENMTHYKVPALLQIIDEIPKSMVGKVMRRTLQEADPLWQKKA
ncbi:MAG: long-chain fatty acid--CoA ligase [Promethearchaeota archaeon]